MELLSPQRNSRTQRSSRAPARRARTASRRVHGEIPTEVCPGKWRSPSRTIWRRGRKPARFSTSAKTTGPRGAMRPAMFSTASAIKAGSRSRLRSLRARRRYRYGPRRHRGGSKNQELNWQSQMSISARATPSTFSRSTTRLTAASEWSILDPPAFAKNRDSIPAAHRGYKEINLRALKILKPGGYLLPAPAPTTSPNRFSSRSWRRRRTTQENIIVVERRTQAQDHPFC